MFVILYNLVLVVLLWATTKTMYRKEKVIGKQKQHIERKRSSVNTLTASGLESEADPHSPHVSLSAQIFHGLPLLGETESVVESSQTKQVLFYLQTHTNTHTPAHKITLIERNANFPTDRDTNLATAPRPNGRQRS